MVKKIARFIPSLSKGEPGEIFRTILKSEAIEDEAIIEFLEGIEDLGR